MPYDDIPLGDEQLREEVCGFCALCGQPLADPVAEIEPARE